VAEFDVAAGCDADRAGIVCATLLGRARVAVETGALGVCATACSVIAGESAVVLTGVTGGEIRAPAIRATDCGAAARVAGKGVVVRACATLEFPAAAVCAAGRASAVGEGVVCTRVVGDTGPAGIGAVGCRVIANELVIICPRVVSGETRALCVCAIDCSVVVGVGAAGDRAVVELAVAAVCAPDVDAVIRVGGT
jgi:hypothetical protein